MSVPRYSMPLRTGSSRTQCAKLETDRGTEALISFQVCPKSAVLYT